MGRGTPTGWFRVVLILLVGLHQACHLVSSFESTAVTDDPTTVQSDGGLLSDSFRDQALAERCLPWPTAPSWEEPRALWNNVRMEQNGAFLTLDQLTLFLSAPAAVEGDTNRDIYMATRQDRSSPFGVPVVLPGSVNTAAAEYRLVLSPDGLHAVLSTDRDSGNPDLWSASVSEQGRFGPFKPIDALNTGYREFDPWFDATGTRLYFGREGDAHNGIWVSERTDTEGWGIPQPVVLFATARQVVGNPVLSSDGLRLLFNRRPRGASDALFDIWYATRETSERPFAVVGPLEGPNADDYEGHIYLSPDGCDLYFTSRRDGTRRIYHSRIVLP